MYFNFSKNKYWTYLFLFIGFYILMNMDPFSGIWIISIIVCTFIVIRWRAHALEYAADELEKWELKEIIRKYDIPRKRVVKRILPKEEKPRSGLEPLLGALQAPVLPLNDLGDHPNQDLIDRILENKRYFDKQKRKYFWFKVELCPTLKKEYFPRDFTLVMRIIRRMFYGFVYEDQKKYKKWLIIRRNKKRVAYLADKEQLSEDFIFLGSRIFKYVFVPVRNFVRYCCWFILALYVSEFFFSDAPIVLLHIELLGWLQNKFIDLILLYFPKSFSVNVYLCFLVWSVVGPLKQVYRYFKKNVFFKTLVSNMFLLVYLFFILLIN
jgi:hypothetical protein